MSIPATIFHHLTVFGLSEQMSATLTSFGIFSGLFAVSYGYLSNNKRVQDLNRENREKLYIMLPSQVHALVVCVNALLIVLGSDNEVLLKDRMYGTTALAGWTHAFSCGYFLYDFVVVLMHLPVDMKFLLHAVVCGLAYWYAQNPLFQYYTIRFLLFELSTPMLNIMSLAQILSWPKKWQTIVEKLFGACFVGCRLIYGLPMAIAFDRYLIDLFLQQQDPKTFSSNVPSSPMLAFCIFAISSMAGLNVVWFLLALFGKKPAAHMPDKEDAQRKSK